MFTRENYVVVTTRPKCFASFAPNFLVALHPLCTFQPEVYLKTGEGSVRFSYNLYVPFSQCKILIDVYIVKLANSALFWRVLVPVIQSFL